MLYSKQLNKMTDNIFTSRNRKTWADPNFWQKVCPGLSIGGSAKTTSNNDSFLPRSDEADKRREQLVEDGYTLIDSKLDSSLIQKLLEGVKALQGGKENIGAKLPASCILLFDETWELARTSREILKRSTHEDNDFNFDILSWYIETGGFSPHRDRQPENASTSFHPDGGQAKFVTHWIALSDAAPENSCLYVIPKSQDPGYTEGDIDDEEPLRRALPSKESFQNIRALPRVSGSSLLFTSRIIHWGSARVPSSEMPPRAAISFVCSDPTYEKPYIDLKYFTENENPPFHIRLLLVCSQLLIYYQRFGLPKETIKACYEYCKEYEDELEETYRHKVFLEFVNSMKSFNGEEDMTSKQTSGKVEVSINDDDDKDDEDAVLEEMLNAEEGGYGEFQDDYDDVEDGEDEEEGATSSRQDNENEDYEDEEEEEEEGVSLFGPETKKLKTR